MPVISGPKELAEFRNHWDGDRMLELVRKHGGRLRVDWAVGVGKSHNIDLTIEAAINTCQYDLVVALLPTRQIINERKWIIDPPPVLRIVNLEPRPTARCGSERDRTWKKFEKNRAWLEI